ncbi:MAG: hypothetical protein MI755_08265 [Sphingomonadales bacterium]|nr:hypothetical protein [Sphingomonadales bacterium]
MTRSKLFLSFAASVLAVVALSTDAEAGCPDADRCTLEQCQERQRAVHPTCDRPRACSRGMTRAQLTTARFRSVECLDARVTVQACFSNPDRGHQQAIQNVMRSIEKCDDLLGD